MKHVSDGERRATTDERRGSVPEQARSGDVGPFRIDTVGAIGLLAPMH